MPVYVEREGIESCISKIQNAIEEMTETAKSIDTSMTELEEYWKGAAFDRAKGTYEADYQELLMDTIPARLTEFKEFINKCKEEIINIDEQLSSL